jgi:hypothetical protein
MVEGMINEVHFVGKLEGNANMIIHTPVVHSDNDSVHHGCFERVYADCMRAVHVNLALMIMLPQCLDKSALRTVLRRAFPYGVSVASGR